jgi:hypothetical protein
MTSTVWPVRMSTVSFHTRFGSTIPSRARTRDRPGAVEVEGVMHGMVGVNLVDQPDLDPLSDADRQSIAVLSIPAVRSRNLRCMVAVVLSRLTSTVVHLRHQRQRLVWSRGQPLVQLLPLGLQLWCGPQLEEGRRRPAPATCGCQPPAGPTGRSGTDLADHHRRAAASVPLSATRTEPMVDRNLVSYQASWPSS